MVEVMGKEPLDSPRYKTIPLEILTTPVCVTMHSEPSTEAKPTTNFAELSVTSMETGSEEIVMKKSKSGMNALDW